VSKSVTLNPLGDLEFRTGICSQISLTLPIPFTGIPLTAYPSAFPADTQRLQASKVGVNFDERVLNPQYRWPGTGLGTQLRESFVISLARLVSFAESGERPRSSHN